MSKLDQKMMKALAHPLRVAILRELEKGPSSPNRLSERLGERIGNVSYHSKVLLDCECIELVETRPARGAVEHFYKLSPRGPIGSATWTEIPSALRATYADSSLAGFTQRAIAALDAGTVESREGSGLTWLPLTLDETGWRELRRVLQSCEKRSRGVADKSAERMESPGSGISVLVAFAAFEMPAREDVDPR